MEVFIFIDDVIWRKQRLVSCFLCLVMKMVVLLNGTFYGKGLIFSADEKFPRKVTFTNVQFFYVGMCKCQVFAR